VLGTDVLGPAPEGAGAARRYSANENRTS